MSNQEHSDDLDSFFAQKNKKKQNWRNITNGNGGESIWQYGGTLSLLPALTADYYGSKNLGFNYGLVFIGWGIAFFVPQAAGYIKDMTGSLDYAFYLSGGLLLTAVLVSQFLRRPLAVGEV